MTQTLSAALELRRRGATALQDGDADAAEAACRAALRTNPKDIYALIGLGMVARLRGDRGKALQFFRHAATVWPVHSWPLLEIGVELVARNELEEAEAALRQALHFDPRNYHVQMALGRCLRQRGRHEQALEFFRGAAQAEPAQPAAYFEWGQLLAHLGHADEALARFDQALACGAPAAEVQAAKALLLLPPAGRHDEAQETFPAGRYDEVRAVSLAVIADESAAPSLRHAAALKAGHVAKVQGKTADAVMFLKRAMTLDPEHGGALRELADICRAGRHFHEADELYRALLAREPGDLAAIGGLGIVQRELGDFAAALELFGRAAAIDAENAWIGYERALTLRGMGRDEEARAILDAIAPDSAMYGSARMMLGHMARAAGAYPRALEYFEQAAAGGVADALHQIAGIKCALGDFAGAEAVVAQILARDANAHEAHMADAYLRREMGEFARARQGFARAASLAPAEVQPLVELAFEERRQGDLAAAMAAIDKALALNPQHEGALLKKAMFLVDRGRIAEALAVYAELRAALPSSLCGHIEAAQLLSEQGELEAARALLAEARRRCPATSDIDLREAGILQRHGFPDEAFSRLTLVHARYPNQLWPWLSRATAAADLGQDELAEALLSAPPGLSVREQTHVLGARAHLEKTRWRLDAALAALDALLAIDAGDAHGLYERAKLRLISFDLPGAWRDLEAHAALQTAEAQRAGRSANPSQSHAGQIYEEFVLDPRLAAELQAAGTLAPDGKILKFISLVQEFPDKTGPAIGLMIALRQGGRLGRRPRPGQPARIPRLITQFWNDAPPPPGVRRILQSWGAVEPECRIELFSDATAAAYLGAHFPAGVARAFRQAKQPAQRADLFRLARLYREGGYYVDADDRARGGLLAHTPPGVAFFAYQEELGSVGNNILGAAPGHPVFELALRAAVGAIMRDDREIVWLSTGPGLLTRAFAQWLAAEPVALEAKLADTAILTATEMNRAAAMFCHAAYKTTSRSWLNAAFVKRRA